MCHYITATLPSNADLARLVPIAAEHRRAFTPLHNPHIEAQLGPTVRYYLTTVGHCDCSTALGSARREQSRFQVSAEHTAKKVADLRRRGWSARKIEHWLEQKAATAARSRRIRREHADEHTPSAEEWYLFIRAVLASGSTDSLGLLLHWYSGALDSEGIEVQDRRSIIASTFDAKGLLELSEDVLYDFRL